MFNLNATGLTQATGITYQWYSSTLATGPWNAITNATNTAYASTASVTTFFKWLQLVPLARSRQLLQLYRTHLLIAIQWAT